MSTIKALYLNGAVVGQCSINVHNKDFVFKGGQQWVIARLMSTIKILYLKRDSGVSVLK